MARPTSLHRQIADQLRERIAKGEFEQTGLTPERSLVREFDVSRHTVRQALNVLENEGLIERRAGLGTSITARAKGGVWAIGSLEQLIGEFSVDQYLTLSAELVPARRFPSAADLFQTRKGSQLFHILRILTVSALPYALCNIFTTPKAAAAIPASEIGCKPLIVLVEDHAGLTASSARQLASAAAADEVAARQLAVPVGSAMLVLHRTYFDGDGAPIVHSELLCRPDRYHQVIDFAREKDNAQ